MKQKVEKTFNVTSTKSRVTFQVEICISEYNAVNIFSTAPSDEERVRFELDTLHSAIRISSHSDFKTHSEYVQKLFGVKIKRSTSSVIPIDEFKEIEDAYNSIVKTIDNEKARQEAELEAKQDAQPKKYFAYNFLDWGDYTINQERAIEVHRKKLDDSGEYEHHETMCRMWNGNIGAREEEWTRLVGEITYTEITKEEADKWAEWAEAEEKRKTKEKEEAETIAKAKAIKRREAEEKEKKEIEDNELFIWQDEEIYSRAGSKMMHSLGLKIGKEKGLRIYTTTYSKDIPNASTTFSLKGKLREDGWKWDGDEKNWVLPYSEENVEKAISFLKEHDTKAWPSILGMEQCWECGTHFKPKRWQYDGGMPYCGC